jgi:hypothetical protein
MKIKEFLEAYVKYLYSGARCFEMDEAFTDEAEALEVLTDEYYRNPETIHEAIREDIAAGVYEGSERMLAMLEAAENKDTEDLYKDIASWEAIA